MRADQERRDTFRPVRAGARSLQRRVLLVAGLAAAGWLIGTASAAHADEQDAPLSAVTDQLGEAVAEAEGSAEGVGETASDTVTTGAAADLDTAGAVGDAAEAATEMAEELGVLSVAEAVGSGRTLRPVSDLGSELPELSEFSGAARDAAVARPAELLGGFDVVADLPAVLGGSRDEDRADVAGEQPNAGSGASQTDGEGRGTVRRESAAETAQAPTLDPAHTHGGLDAFRGTVEPGQTGVPGQTGEPEPWNNRAASADRGSGPATAGSSSGSAPAAAAGYLVSRADLARGASERAYLPAGPAPVVRDAADDPSFSPD